MKNSCPIHIGPKQRRRRLIAGILMFIVSSAIAIFLLSSGLSRVRRLFLFFPFYLSMLGFLQAKAKTCVAPTFQGARNLDQETEKVSEAESSALRSQGRNVLIQAALVSAALTAICFLL